MKNFKLINNVTGWVAFVISLIVYTLTLEPSVSFWDCGEFISASYRLQVVHPPGAPLFLLVGRIFSLFAMGDTMLVADAVNMLSAVTSALTVLFTFWIITHFAKKILVKNEEDMNSTNLFAILASGMVGALTLTFTDSFWFSAVEAEVYASSSFFTALTFWAILKWENVAFEKHGDKWIILIAYITGLAIGMHLLNLLVIPAVAYFYYFKKYEFTTWGFIKATIAGFGTLLFIQYGIIPGLPTLTAYSDLFFVNSLGLPMASGAFFSLILLIGAIIFGLYYTYSKRMYVLNNIILAFAFIIIGYSSYATVVIRSLANPPIDMNDPEDPFNLLSYINREQYGDRPLFYGPYYTAKAVSYKEGKMQYRRGKEKYEEIGNKIIPVFDPAHSTVFPRMGDMQKEGGAQGYRQWSGAQEGKKPTFAQNMNFLFRYQLGWMYWRYFFWNFVGRQNDEQGHGDPINGNWISGIEAIDSWRLGPQLNLPDHLASNKGRNTYFFLPMVLGLLGMVYHFMKSKKDAFVVTTLFVFTGILIVIFLNQPPFEPRERDYSHVGSFQTFCIWVGLGVLFIFEYFSKKVNKNVAIAGATVISLLASPVLLAKQNWDDHDRSNRFLAVDFANNYLQSCAKNAVLFTNGDNDTYPLWYAQNVEGLRTDVRVINLSLLSTDWYADALHRKQFDSEPIPMTMTLEKYVNGTRDYIRFFENKSLNINPNSYYPLKDVVAFMTSDNPRNKELVYGEMSNYYPTGKFSIPVNKEKVLRNGTVAPEDADLIAENVLFDIERRLIYKGTLVVLDILATNDWERPIYFTTTTGSDVYLNLQEYFQLEGMAFRLVPIKSGSRMGRINQRILHENLMTKFKFGNMEGGKIYVDDKATLVPNNMRGLYAQLASTYIEKGQNDSAIKVMDYCFKMIPESVLPMMNRYKLFFIDNYYQARNFERAKELSLELLKKAEQEVKYYGSFRQTSLFKAVDNDMAESMRDINQLISMAKRYEQMELATTLEATFSRLQPLFQ